MLEQTDVAPRSAADQASDREAIKALGSALNESLRKISEAEQSHLVSMMGVAAVLACLPDTAKVDATRVGALVGVLSRGRPDEEALRDKVAKFAARILTISQDFRIEAPAAPSPATVNGHAA